MTCSRCGSDAVVRRGSAFYCGKCALARDWHEIIQLVQDARVDTPVAGRGSRPEGASDPFVASGA